MLISGVDERNQSKGLQGKALRARDWFAVNGPGSLPPLPITYQERESLHVSPLLYIYSKFARSVASLGYAIEQHPSFEDYARGVMASEQHAPPFITDDEQLKQQFGPTPLEGLGPGLCWRP